MMAIMALKQKLAGLIFAAIVVVALQLVPNLAYAHAGHDHHGPAVTVPVPAASVQPTANETRSAASARAELKAAASHHQPASAPAGTCVGGCCGTGMGCCGSILIVSEQVIPPVDDTADIVASVLNERPGLDPDALKRPPRILS